jgi:radical SAM-linked protein
VTELDRSQKAQRLRIRFAQGAEAAAIGHLDLGRAWERALMEGGLPVSYSAGRKPRPRIALAAALPSGATSAGELLDVILAECMTPDEARTRLRDRLPAGIHCCEIREVGMGSPSLPASVRWADYEVETQPPGAGRPVTEAVAAFLSLEVLPWEEARGDKVRSYDLRSLVTELSCSANAASAQLHMRLRCGPSGAGRPEQVVKALGLPELVRTHRVRLVLDEVSPARNAWRRRGRYLG